MSMEKVEIGSSAVILTGLAGALAKLSVLSGAGAGLSATIPDNSETGAALGAARVGIGASATVAVSSFWFSAITVSVGTGATATGATLVGLWGAAVSALGG